MPQALTFPGVYIEEVPSGVRTIIGVATSIGAFVDFFREGPLNRAVQIFGMADFEREFGGLDTRSEASYAISQFFLNGGSEAWVVRAAPAAGVNAPVKANVTIKKGMTAAAGEVIKVSAVSEGAWGNSLRVTVAPSTLGADRFDLTAVRYASPDPKAPVVKAEKYLGLSVTEGTSKYFVEVLKDQSKLIGVEDVRSAASKTAGDLPAPNGSFSKADIALTPAQITALNGKKIKVKIGAPAAVDATITFPAGATVDDLRKVRGPLEEAIRGAAPDNPAFAGATVELIGNRYLVKSGRGDNYLPTDVVDISNSGADTTADDLQFTGAGRIDNVQEYGLGPDPAGSAVGTNIKGMKVGVKGLDGEPPGASDIIGSEALKTGMYALKDVDLFNILCLPRAAEIGVANPAQMDQIIAKALAFCKDRRAFLVVDIPPTINEVQEVKDWLATRGFLGDPNGRNAAVYFPRLKIVDPLDDFRLHSRGASGTMAGVYARTDSGRGVWKAPAGTEAGLIGVAELDTKLTDPQNGTLNPLGINCLRSFPIYGNIAWGTRTLDGSDQAASEWKYIPIRRLALFLEESLFRGTKWVVFEPNDEPLWAKVRLNVGAFMMSLFRQGAFQGSTPDKAFYVKCDAETTTQDDRNKGIINIEVGFAPLKPAEFVVIKIQQMAGDLK
jgi:phage tail sheath protein FI